ncbi:MAG: LysR family transcriptional regulator [Thiotrichales bacterium]
MDFATLQAFVAVVDTGSFSRAAERLHLTQPAISKRIGALETETGVRLLDRLGKELALTEAGTVLLTTARRVLAEIEDGKRLLNALSLEVGGTLRLGASHHVGLHYLPSILRAYLQEYPRVTPELRFLDSESAAVAVDAGALDLALITLPHRPLPQLNTLPLWQDPLVFVCDPHHVLARGQAVSLETLAGFPAIMPNPHTATRALVETALGARQLTLRISLETDYLETIKSMVITGLGWSVLPRTMVDERLRVLKVPLHLMRHLGLVRHRDRTPSNAALAFSRHCDASAMSRGG